MDDQLNVPLEDSELLAEVELTTNLIIAASGAEASLPQAEVDRLLGLDDDGLSNPIPIQKARNSACGSPDPASSGSCAGTRHILSCTVRGRCP